MLINGFITIVVHFIFFLTSVLSVPYAVHNKVIVTCYSVWKELSVCLVKEGDSFDEGITISVLFFFICLSFVSS